MSLRLISKCWDITGLHPTQKLILISLADQANDAGVCWPSIETIAKRSGISERSAQRIINGLIESGLIARSSRPGRSNIFYITPDTHDTPDAGDTPDTHDGGGVTPMTGGGDTHDTQNRKEPSKNRKPSPRGDDPPGFDTFWQVYPRKVGKGAARKAWKKIKPSAELTREIVRAVEIQKRSADWLKNDGQFIPHPTTWLNQGRWQDEIPEPPKGSRFVC